ncbi:MAG: hypothetical protein LN566_06155 [Rickettsia endosymbiont of Stiretrus anchorago]|nr:hypothetical protein [Rickettsia endosymbiont of Stiretrus anchorago]
MLNRQLKLNLPKEKSLFLWGAVHKKELNSIIEFTKEHNPKHSIVVSLEENKRVIKFDDQKIIIYPVEEFLSDLWNGLLF